MAWVVAKGPASHGENDRAKAIRHSGVQVGEIIGYRAWRVTQLGRWWGSDDWLRSVFISDYLWDPDRPASGNVQAHGIYSFKHAIRSKEEYGQAFGRGVLLFGRVKLWGEVVEHELGYRSQFARIISLDYGEPELLEKFRRVYRVNVPAL